MKSTLLALMLFASTALATDLPRVYIEATETVDASNAEHKANQVDFGAPLPSFRPSGNPTRERTAKKGTKK